MPNEQPQPEAGANNAPAKIGRPELPIDREVCARICDAVSKGASLTAAVQDEAVSIPTVYKWLREDKAFSDDYAHAREVRGEYYGGRVAELAQRCEAGEVDPSAARVAMDGYKWTAARMAPKQWGDKQQIDVTSQGESIRPILVAPGSLSLVEWQQQVQVLQTQKPPAGELPAEDKERSGDEGPKRS